MVVILLHLGNAGITDERSQVRICRTTKSYYVFDSIFFSGRRKRWTDPCCITKVLCLWFNYNSVWATGRVTGLPAAFPILSDQISGSDLGVLLCFDLARELVSLLHGLVEILPKASECLKQQPNIVTLGQEGSEGLFATKALVDSRFVQPWVAGSGGLVLLRIARHREASEVKVRFRW